MVTPRTVERLPRRSLGKGGLEVGRWAIAACPPANSSERANSLTTSAYGDSTPTGAAYP